MFVKISVNLFCTNFNITITITYRGSSNTKKQVLLKHKKASLGVNNNYNTNKSFNIIKLNIVNNNLNHKRIMKKFNENNYENLFNTLTNVLSAILIALGVVILVIKLIQWLF